MAHCLRDWVLPWRAVIGIGTGPIISIHQRLILVVPPIAANVPRVVLAVSDSERRADMDSISLPLPTFSTIISCHMRQSNVYITISRSDY